MITKQDELIEKRAHETACLLCLWMKRRRSKLLQTSDSEQRGVKTKLQLCYLSHVSPATMDPGDLFSKEIAGLSVLAIN